MKRIICKALLILLVFCCNAFCVFSSGINNVVVNSKLQLVQNSGSVEANAVLTNNNSDEITVYLILACYDDDIMTDVKKSDFTLTQGIGTEISGKINAEVGQTVKCFIFNSNTQSPVCASEKIILKEQIKVEGVNSSSLEGGVFDLKGILNFGSEYLEDGSNGTNGTTEVDLSQNAGMMAVKSDDNNWLTYRAATTTSVGNSSSRYSVQVNRTFNLPVEIPENDKQYYIELLINSNTENAMTFNFGNNGNFGVIQVRKRDKSNNNGGTGKLNPPEASNDYIFKTADNYAKGILTPPYPVTYWSYTDTKIGLLINPADSKVTFYMDGNLLSENEYDYAIAGTVLNTLNVKMYSSQRWYGLGNPTLTLKHLKVYEHNANAKEGTVTDNDIEILKQRSRANLYAINADATDEFETLNSDGKFSDIIYSGTNWNACDALYRVKEAMQAFKTPDNKFYQNKELIEKINFVLKDWIVNDYQHPSNGWWRTVGVPNVLMDILTLDSNDIDNEVAEQLYIITKRGLSDDETFRRYGTVDTVVNTGANLTDVMKTTIGIALATNDENLLKKASEILNDECKISTTYDNHFTQLNEGMQVDGSFMQHLTLLNNIGYGGVYTRDLIYFYNLLFGTDYSLTKDSVNNFVNMYLDGTQYMGMGEKGDFNINGRGIANTNCQTDWRFLLNYVATTFVNAPDIDRRDELEALIANRLSGTDNFSGAKHFWQADYTTIIRPGSFIGVKTSSVRTKPTEMMNQENVQGYFLGKGVTCIMQNGKEYENIFPVWDWDKVPGTTELQNIRETKEAVDTLKYCWNYFGNTSFVGGVSDGLNACSTMESNRNGLSAQKSWFLYDDGMTALGAGITNSVNLNNNVVTTIDQCLLQGEVTVCDELGVRTIDNGTYALNKVKWILHNNMAYIFNDEPTVNVMLGPATGSWNLISKITGSTAEITKDVLKIWIDYGSALTDGSYNYSVLFGATQEILQNTQSVSVIKNTENLQAVWIEKQNMLQAIFKQAGSVECPNGEVITVDKPCALIFEDLGDSNISVSVSNPYSSEANVKVELSQKYNGMESNVIEFNLPGDIYGGKGVTFKSIE